jgi:hypothetical protein
MFRIIAIGLILGACSGVEERQDPIDYTPQQENNQALAIDSLTGLVVDENFALVRAQCTACHSAKLITQNRATREGWQHMIRWMQAEQGLWDLGDQEPAILDYLSRHYAPQKKGRRAPLTNVEWYDLEQ